jgi:hypothetical protein
LGFPGSRVRSVIPTAVGTPRLFPLVCFHRLILTEEVLEKITGGGSRKERNEIHQKGGTNLIQN